MVSLTSLLVLTGLLTQTSHSIPKTAYLKLIDHWYIFFICTDFVIIVVLAVIECLRQRVRSAKAKAAERKVLSWAEKPTVAGSSLRDASLFERINAIAIVVFPVVFVVFVAVFFFNAYQKFGSD